MLEKSLLGSAITSDTLVMKSINVEGGFLFVEGGIFQNWLAWTPRLLER